MFLLNEIVEPIQHNKSSGDYVGNFFIENYFEDTENPFKKGDLVYFDDYELVNFFQFFHILIYHDSYKNFINTSKLFRIYNSVFSYINCVGTIKKIKEEKIVLNKLSSKGGFTKIYLEIQFPDGKVVKIKNLKFLKLYSEKK